MSTNYKLTYFNVTGVGETVRLIFAAAGQEFEDYRIEYDKWEELKPTMVKSLPFSKLPILEFDGKLLAESQAISRYLANKFGLKGADAWESALIDMIVDATYDIAKEGVEKPHFEKDETKKEELNKKFRNETAPAFFKNLENIMKQHGKGFFIGDKLSWADLAFFHFATFLEKFHPNLLDANETIKEHVHKIEEIPEIKTYLTNRPKTPW